MSNDRRVVSYNEKYSRFDISFPYDAELVSIVKAGVPDRKYHDTKTMGKFWSAPATAHNAAMIRDLLRPKGFMLDAKVDELAGEWELMARAAEDTGRGKRKIRGLYPFQQKGVEFLELVKGRALLADDMGLGKTVQTLRYLDTNTKPGDRILIVAPASVIYKWREEALKWMETARQVKVVEGTTGDLPDGDVLIMSYAAATKRYLQLMRWLPDAIVFDEGHKLKNPKTQRARTASKYIKPARILLILSGTPFLNRPEELFNLLHMIDPKAWKNFFDFAMRYCDAHQNNYGQWDFSGATNQEELSERLKSVMVRRLKRDVLEQLPDLSRVILPVSIKKGDYAKVAKDKDMNPLEKLTALRQIVGKGKATVASEWAKDFLESSDEKLVLYAHHREIVKKLQEDLEDFHPVVIQGDTPNEKRSEAVHQFQEEEKYRVAIITQAGGEGIDLFAASNILFVEREWSPLYEEQIEARLHRMGQENAVTAYYLAALGTVDEHLAEYVEAKRTNFHKIVGGQSIESIIKEEMLKEL